MKPQHYLIRSMLLYPGIMPDIGSVFRHAFFTCGNGTDWVNGELTMWAAQNEPPITDEPDIQALAAHGRAGLMRTVIDSEKSFGKSSALAFEDLYDLHKYEFRASHIHPITQQEGWCHQRIERIYSLPFWSQYAQILHVPENVTDEWLDAAYQCAQVTLATLQQHQGLHGFASTTTQQYLGHLPRVVRELDNRLIARGLHSTPAEREALINECVMKEADAEWNATLKDDDAAKNAG